MMSTPSDTGTAHVVATFLDDPLIDPDARAALMEDLMKSLIDVVTPEKHPRLYAAISRGREEGREEGRVQTRAEILASAAELLGEDVVAELRGIEDVGELLKAIVRAHGPDRAPTP